LTVRFAILYCALVGPMAATADVEVYELLPQAGRLHLDFEIGACLLLGCAGWALFRLLPRWSWPAAIAVALVAAVAQYGHYRWRARFDTQRADLAKRSEATTARWLDANMHGGRVYVTGSTSFFLNSFSSTPQLIGCCEQGLAMPVLNEVPYKVNTLEGGNTTESGVNWLRALGVQALVVNGVESTDVYKDIRLPQRFDGVLPLMHRENGDSIYAVLPAGASLAHVVRREELVPVRPPGRFEYADILRYAQATGDGSRAPAAFEWVRGNRGRIRAALRKGEVVSVQVAWFPGWKVIVRGQATPVAKDGMGFLVIEPGCEGECEIDLAWTGRGDFRWTAGVSAATAVLLVTMLIRSRSLAYL
jgi:hypothetical protein